MEARMTALLQVRGLTRAFGGVRAVDDVSFDLDRGELLALLGPNGAGKSTCFNMINGQLKPDAGEVLLDGANIIGRSRAISGASASAARSRSPRHFIR
jgi:branched-chain amino acid transport system ATP-binding protein